MNESAQTTPCVRFAAVGDILLTPPPPGTHYERDEAFLADDVAAIFANCDLVFGNLECTLPGSGCVPTEPRVMSTPALLRAVKQASLSVVTLANNHMFDGLDEGFQNVRAVLEEIELPYFGAGMNIEQATAPVIIEKNGVKLAFVGAVDCRSGPFQFAGSDRWGVAPLDLDLLGAQIRELSPTVDHVLVSLHWGEERLLFPSPVQIEQARALCDAGASVVLGHHPHVIQGFEMWRGRPIIYSLGNFTADDVYFSLGDAIRWNRTERTGCILLAELRPDGISAVRQIPTFDSGRKVAVDDSGFGRRRIDRANRALARGVSLGRYRREHLWVKTILPTLRHLRFSELSRIRPRHFRNALRMVLKAGRAD